MILSILKKYHNSRKQITLLQGGFVIVLLSAVLWATLLIRENTVLQESILEYGYSGLALVSFLSGFNVLVPVPAISFVPIVVESGLNFWLAIGIITVCMTSGDALGYIIGLVGRALISHKRLPEIMADIAAFSKKNSYSVYVFYFLFGGFIPLPNELVVVPGALLKLPWYQVLIPLTLGNLTFNIVTGLGLIGLTSLF